MKFLRKGSWTFGSLPPYAPVRLRIADKILSSLLLGMAVPALLTSPFGLYYLVRGGIRYYFRKNDFHREVKRLEKKGYIALTKTPNGFLVRLLKKGRGRWEKSKLDEIRLPKDKIWDKRWRLFSFDIPEKERSARNRLRQKLKDLGMYNIQRSLFAYPYDCHRELDDIAEYFGLAKYTTYAEATFVDIDKQLRRYFKLKSP